jgi:crossover junction endodeoxyribonuclease RuvC
MLLALDLGTKCGFCYGSVGSHVSGTWEFKNSRYEGGGMRYLKLRRKLDEMHATKPITEVVFEEVRRHAATDAAHVYGGLLGILTAWCEENTVPYRGVPVGTIKKFATTKGNAPKEQMIAAVRSWGYEPIDDNEADAIALFRLALTESGA